jgi:hypothetical protein
MCQHTDQRFPKPDFERLDGAATTRARQQESSLLSPRRSRRAVRLGARFADTTDFRLWLLLNVTECVVIAERVERTLASVAARTLKGADGGDERARNQHQFEVEGPCHVVNGGEARIDRGALEIGDLALPQTQLPSEFRLTEVTTQACSLENFVNRLTIIDK